jgi:methionyl-tRNA synthetase
MVKLEAILKAEPIAGTHKLLRLEVDIGEEKLRQTVASLRPSYEAKDLIGKQVVFFANLKPAKLRGIKSEGMILAALEEEKVVLVGPLEKVKEGTRVC